LYRKTRTADEVSAESTLLFEYLRWRLLVAHGLSQQQVYVTNAAHMKCEGEQGEHGEADEGDRRPPPHPPIICVCPFPSLRSAPISSPFLSRELNHPLAAHLPPATHTLRSTSKPPCRAPDQHPLRSHSSAHQPPPLITMHIPCIETCVDLRRTATVHTRCDEVASAPCKEESIAVACASGLELAYVDAKLLGACWQHVLEALGRGACVGRNGGKMHTHISPRRAPHDPWRSNPRANDEHPRRALASRIRVVHHAKNVSLSHVFRSVLVLRSAHGCVA
jgi:hypothetical protein